MSLLDYFNQGRQNEREHVRKQKVRTIPKKYGKPSPFSPTNLIVGAGVLFEIVYPKVKPITDAIKNRVGGVLHPICRSVKGDIQTVCRKIRKVNPDWEDYQRFLELARK